MRVGRWITRALKWLLFIIPFYSFSLLGSGLILGSKGPILVAYWVSIFIGFRTIGFRYEKKSGFLESRVGTSQWGRLTISHSHHLVGKNNDVHEIRIGNKSFCARCYGMIIGIAFSLVITTIYLVNYLNDQLFVILLSSLPLLITLSGLYFPLKRRYGALARFSSGFLLPILGWNTLIVFDHMYHSWIINSLILFLVFIGTNLTGFYRLHKRSFRN
ncbi:MAG: DUF2085 domain-containing protein [Promethearchaeota archaeon]